MTVSESTAASSIVAVGRWGSRPWRRKRSTTRVAVLPTGSKVAATGKRVSIEPMWWWSRISTMWASVDARDALGLLGVVHQQHLARARGSPARPGSRCPPGRRRSSTAIAAL